MKEFKKNFIYIIPALVAIVMIVGLIAILFVKESEAKQTLLMIIIGSGFAFLLTGLIAANR